MLGSAHSLESLVNSSEGCSVVPKVVVVAVDVDWVSSSASGELDAFKALSRPKQSGCFGVYRVVCGLPRRASRAPVILVLASLGAGGESICSSWSKA